MTGFRKIPFWATLLTLCGVIILCALGSWQLQRLEWKRGIIAQLESAYAREGDQAPDFAANYSYGRVSGIFLPSKAILLGPRTRDGKIGNDLIVPLQMKNETLLVNMGWTDAALDKLPIHHLESKNVSFTGLLRAPNWNRFTPENLPEKDIWYRADIDEIAAAKNLENPLDKIFYAESTNYKFDAAFPNNERWQPRNDHLQYAIFWFTLAGALVAVYALRFLRKN